MSSSQSQSASFPPIPFTTTVPQQPFRLLELTPELVEIIESQRETSSKRRKLWFKSSPARDLWSGKGSNGGGGAQLSGDSVEGVQAQEGFLHLCSDEKVWAVKQVSTSNSVHVTRAMTDGELQRLEEERDGDGGEDTAMLGSDEATSRPEGETGEIPKATGGITSISQVKNILELLEIPPPSEKDVEAMLVSMVPVFADDQTEGDRYSASNPPKVSLSEVFENIPAPTEAVFAAMKRLFMFEHKHPAQPSSSKHDRKQAQKVPSKVYIPSTNLLLTCWIQFASQCDISGVKLQQHDGLEYSKLQDLLAKLTEAGFDPSEGSLVNDVIMSIIRQVGQEIVVQDPNESVKAGEDNYRGPLIQQFFSDAVVPEGTHMRFDPATTRTCVGKWLLASIVRLSTPLSKLQLDSNETLAVEEFLEGWTNLLPESWARDCRVHEFISSVSGWKIVRDATGEEVLKKVADMNDDTQASRTGQAKAQKAKKGKWHEKFGAQRSAAAKK